MKRVLTVLIVGVLALGATAWLGARRPGTPPVDPCARVSHGVPIGPDTGVIAVGGPTVIGFYPSVTVGEDERALEARFSRGFAVADSLLSTRGVAVHWRFADDLRLAGPHGEDVHTVSPDSGSWGYVLATPCRAPTILYGVRGDSAIVALVRRYLF